MWALLTSQTWLTGTRPSNMPKIQPPRGVPDLCPATKTLQSCTQVATGILQTDGLADPARTRPERDPIFASRLSQGLLSHPLVSISHARDPIITHTGMAGWFHSIPGGGALMALGIANVAMSATCWWRDCIIESDMGMHTEVGAPSETSVTGYLCRA